MIEAISAANQIDSAYDEDSWSKQLDGAFSDMFGKQVRALWVATGTAANCLGLATLCPPHGAILCHEMAHIEVDEAGAPGFFTHGAKLSLLPGYGAKLTPDTVEEACARVRDDVGHVTQLCVHPAFRNLGLARIMLEESGKILRYRGFRARSLTVTEGNEKAVGIYPSEGFRTIHTFDAAVWMRES